MATTLRRPDRNEFINLNALLTWHHYALLILSKDFVVLRPAGKGHVREMKTIMKKKVTSLKFIKKDGTPLNYVMVEGEDIDQSISIARKWATKNIKQPYEEIELHQGVMSAPEFDEYEIIDSFRVWNLPF